jgi:Nucleoside-diphosphate-sugar epimerases
MKNILVTGGCGYKGTVLVEKLIDRGDKVTVIDTQWFGNFLTPNNNLRVIKEDIRNITEFDEQYDSVIHLASIANDPSVELNPKLSWEVNVLSTMRLVEAAIKSKVLQFIYASSGSVYGVKDDPEVTEDLVLVPLSEYNKTRWLLKECY